MVPIPKTSLEHYITGITALNIPLPAEGNGDWHFHEAFYGRGNRASKIFVAGEGEEWNTNPIFGNFGIYACEKILVELGLPVPNEEHIYAAGHYRAVLDMLYSCIRNGNYPFHIDLDQWFETSEQKAFLLEKAEEMTSVLNSKEKDILKKWILSQS